MKSLSALDGPKETGISIITPPPVTLKTLGEARDLGISSVWLQPGTFDDEVLKFAYDNFSTVLAGDGGWGGEGWCILVDGERAYDLLASSDLFRISSERRPNLAEKAERLLSICTVG